MLTGGCLCGAIRYELAGGALNHLLCHCRDCQRASGAPVVAWILVQDTQISVTGKTQTYASSESGRRSFCGQCGTSLFYTNAEFMADRVDIQTATLDKPEELAPQAHVQTAERIPWMEHAHELPQHKRWVTRS